MASSTVTLAIVSFVCCGFVTRIADLARLELDPADVELVERRRRAADEVERARRRVDANSATTPTSRSSGTSAQSRQAPARTPLGG